MLLVMGSDTITGESKGQCIEPDSSSVDGAGAADPQETLSSVWIKLKAIIPLWTP